MSSENRDDIVNDQEDLNTETSNQETEVSENELTVEDQVLNLQAELDKEKDKFLRLFAEFENYKRRTGKERVEMFKTAGQEVMQSMLPVLDDFDRALIEIQKAKDKNLQKGVELISNKLRETLKSKGLKEMEVSAGDVFDADIHEAITQIPAPKDSLKGKIVDVIEKGYELGEKIIRFPKVVTGK
ncbi:MULTISPECIES: nucleotide exchange factor GrpE [Leeuwenhoekiella]|jgi:molecular chaperone GrpE|uniref:Protein GrpE n=1 Tax=Leeuwenhoekiella aequorea TaxID=283736 RepID=A0A4Q0PEK2_9FLAO|nr:nucleotide exchange factor GrpE [Leeuwenhoekiella aequorea]RXG24926.1 molecular chaperone GrpE [Leeuwenhoekiella aequorea]|tara:strand:+ start:430 stop:984 length:555 start_codon:yes stop_codon:yes gene_type:complete